MPQAFNHSLSLNLEKTCCDQRRHRRRDGVRNAVIGYSACSPFLFDYRYCPYAAPMPSGFTATNSLTSSRWRLKNAIESRVWFISASRVSLPRHTMRAGGASGTAQLRSKKSPTRRPFLLLVGEKVARGTGQVLEYDDGNGHGGLKSPRRISSHSWCY